MTRLEKYLLATASEIIEAETTVSRYFVIGNVKYEYQTIGVKIVMQICTFLFLIMEELSI